MGARENRTFIDLQVLSQRLCHLTHYRSILLLPVITILPTTISSVNPGEKMSDNVILFKNTLYITIGSHSLN